MNRACATRRDFRKCGGHDYDHTFSYSDRLCMQRTNGGMTLKGIDPKPPFFDRDHWRVEPAEHVAGCQLADVVANAVYQAVNFASPLWDLEPA